ncbi:MAG: FkbM family methyltransferase [Flavobacteriaceae bacterium]|nr:FkbM family methyltransferase [Flavobacteriaceae bacterium]
MKQLLKKCFRNLGYNIIKISQTPLLNDNIYLAIKHKVNHEGVFFDIGANSGQTITKIKQFYPNCDLHSFEPSKICFSYLSQNFGESKRLKLNNVAMGAKKELLDFNEYSWSALNSFLTRAYTKSKIIDNYKVEVTTIDDYCFNNKIKSISLLKTDTEGFELNVLKGATNMMMHNHIQFVYVEIFFNLNYVGQSSFGDIYNYLLEKGFDLVRFYDVGYTESGLASKTDALFINQNFNPE